MLIDLNVQWPQRNYATPPTPQEIIKLKNTISTLEELGYTHIALNFTVNHKDKIPSNQQINPINFDLLKEFQGRIKFFSRVTIIIDEPSQGQSISKLQNGFDIISVLPISEKGVLLACNSLDIDIITFQYDKRLPCFLKQKTIGAAVKKGIKFEITYSNFIKDQGNSRAQFINNSLNLIRASRNQNIIVSSGATSSLEIRNFPDVLNLLDLLGFKKNYNLIDKASKVLLSGRLRNKSYKQTIMIGEDAIEDEANLNKRNIKDINGGDVFKQHLKKLKSGK
ncbi:hypothetical protein BN7_6120 [Wickerhamomyces ciferrii]|uniref:Uncharacterized protein n=1 Tax=Wickerhamomyces ciferrii (strain ATCC 14091 / BCRC 22168 / CBS 111 / JCM 3599 / NBRC 0793 / NRRL Y-1031 F-60-10) TaxID=1206466 RepID=K0KWV7_WICCF|nr:uncharacterized protein BN7_6120 [Wickerhamomyces ciferrii]CCH46527.1 hypothetical protein BN7_6120 [Wickerhamomyces ciferrii]